MRLISLIPLWFLFFAIG